MSDDAYLQEINISSGVRYGAADLVNTFFFQSLLVENIKIICCFGGRSV